MCSLSSSVISIRGLGHALQLRDHGAAPKPGDGGGERTSPRTSAATVPSPAAAPPYSPQGACGARTLHAYAADLPPAAASPAVTWTHSSSSVGATRRISRSCQPRCTTRAKRASRGSAPGGRGRGEPAPPVADVLAGRLRHARHLAEARPISAGPSALRPARTSRTTRLPRPGPPQFVDRAGGGDPAARDDHQVRAGLLDLRQDVAGQEHRVLLAERPDQPPRLLDLRRVQADRRLVQDEDRRVGHERLGQAHALAEPLESCPMRRRRTSLSQHRSMTRSAAERRCAGSLSGPPGTAGTPRPASRGRAARFPACSRWTRGPPGFR